MRKSRVIILIILILGGLGYFAYSKGLVKLDYFKKGEVVVNNEVAKEAEKFSDVGESIQGDFNGDGKKETAEIIQTRVGYGNPVEDGISDIYEIQFSDVNIPSINILCCHANLINEGDLNNDKKDDFSVYQAPENGTVYNFTTYSFINNNWKDIIPSFLISDNKPNDSLYVIGLGGQQLKDRVFKEGNSFAYYYDIKSEVINNKKFEFYFKVVGGPKGPEESGYQSILLVTSDGKKILEDTDSISAPGTLFYEIDDINGDGYKDIKWQTVTACGKCGEFFNLYVFDPKTNTFKATTELLGQQNIKPEVQTPPKSNTTTAYMCDGKVKIVKEQDSPSLPPRISYLRVKDNAQVAYYGDMGAYVRPEYFSIDSSKIEEGYSFNEVNFCKYLKN